MPNVSDGCRRAAGRGTECRTSASSSPHERSAGAGAPDVVRDRESHELSTPEHSSRSYHTLIKKNITGSPYHGIV